MRLLSTFDRAVHVVHEEREGLAVSRREDDLWGTRIRNDMVPQAQDREGGRTWSNPSIVVPLVSLSCAARTASIDLCFVPSGGTGPNDSMRGMKVELSGK